MSWKDDSLWTYGGDWQGSWSWDREDRAIDEQSILDDDDWWSLDGDTAEDKEYNEAVIDFEYARENLRRVRAARGFSPIMPPIDITSDRPSGKGKGGKKSKREGKGKGCKEKAHSGIITRTVAPREWGAISNTGTTPQPAVELPSSSTAFFSGND